MKLHTFSGGALVLVLLGVSSLSAQEFTKDDLFVAHTPTVGGHVGMTLPLYVRHVTAANPAGEVAEENRVVLFIHGGTTPVAAGYDLDFSDYSWMEALAQEGFDVWAMDQTGYGGSARPFMDDPCNVDPELQDSLLVGNVLEATCSAHHPTNFNTIRGEWEEIGTVVDHILDETGADSLSMIGWSAGGPRAGGYTSQNPDKVNRLFLFAPSAPNAERQPVDSPEEGFTTTLRDKQGFGESWAEDTQCEGQVEEGALDAYWEASMTWDPIGATWGPEGQPGYVRGPVRTNAVWTPDMAAALQAPLLVIAGEFDVPETRRESYEQAGSPEKVFVLVDCASHFMLWEKQRHALHDASIEWLRDGTYQGESSGAFHVGENGDVGVLN
ncbi:alpha/beta hydrolase [Roseitranquillus sediminis]|uniref:alpha/beta hydrolase n=1 Tax=Roseitranquillus sediminis TaxID=2809051 RepID=UPI001D0C29A6|nr:alpha/beta fold hydrolase [Roseitranquillus sediminis]MBM9595505.1 alpha/beta fold hydrolase [Roseitranquillus sediminis]